MKTSICMALGTTVLIAFVMAALARGETPAGASAHQNQIWGSVHTEDRSTMNIFDKEVFPFLIKDETPRVERVPRERSHSNGITGIPNLTLAVEDPDAIRVPYTRVFGRSPQSIQKPEVDGAGVRFRIGTHALDLIASKSTRGLLVDWIKLHGQSPYAATLAGPAGTRLDPALLQGARLSVR